MTLFTARTVKKLNSLLFKAIFSHQKLRNVDNEVKCWSNTIIQVHCDLEKTPPRSTSTIVHPLIEVRSQKIQESNDWNQSVLGRSAIFPILKTEVKGGIVALSVKFVVRASFSSLNIGTLNNRENYNRISKFRKLIIEIKAFWAAVQPFPSWNWGKRWNKLLYRSTSIISSDKTLERWITGETTAGYQN